MGSSPTTGTARGRGDQRRRARDHHQRAGVTWSASAIVPTSGITGSNRAATLDVYCDGTDVDSGHYGNTGGSITINPPPPPPAPSGVCYREYQLTTSQPAVYGVNWTEVPGATQYQARFHYYTDALGGWTSWETRTVEVRPTGSSCELLGDYFARSDSLFADKYQWSVRAGNANGWSGWADLTQANASVTG